MYYKYSEYKGEKIKELPFDIGKILFELNWSMSSLQLNEYVYQNNNGDLFYVKGVYQHTSGIGEYHRDDIEHYHLALVRPIKDSKSLSQYLSTKETIDHIFDKDGYSYVLKLDAQLYEDKDGKKYYTLRHVDEEGNENGNIKEIPDFNLYEAKKCKTTEMPDVLNPFEIPWGLYEHRKDLSFIFNNEEDKIAIDQFIKNN